MTYGAFFYNWDKFNIIVAQTSVYRLCFIGDLVLFSIRSIFVSKLRYFF